MALEISYSPQFFDSLEDILNYFDERNGSDRFSKKLLKMIHKQIKLASTMPEIPITHIRKYINRMSIGKTSLKVNKIASLGIRIQICSPCTLGLICVGLLTCYLL